MFRLEHRPFSFYDPAQRHPCHPRTKPSTVKIRPIDLSGFTTYRLFSIKSAFKLDKSEFLPVGAFDFGADTGEFKQKIRIARIHL
jgi:hypothetical protein